MTGGHLVSRCIFTSSLLSIPNNSVSKSIASSANAGTISTGSIAGSMRYVSVCYLLTSCPYSLCPIHRRKPPHHPNIVWTFSEKWWELLEIIHNPWSSLIAHGYECVTIQPWYSVAYTTLPSVIKINTSQLFFMFYFSLRDYSSRIQFYSSNSRILVAMELDS